MGRCRVKLCNEIGARFPTKADASFDDWKRHHSTSSYPLDISLSKLVNNYNYLKMGQYRALQHQKKDQ